jgi:hypothetical protein
VAQVAQVVVLAEMAALRVQPRLVKETSAAALATALAVAVVALVQSVAFLALVVMAVMVRLGLMAQPTLAAAAVAVVPPQRFPLPVAPAAVERVFHLPVVAPTLLQDRRKTVARTPAVVAAASALAAPLVAQTEDPASSSSVTQVHNAALAALSHHPADIPITPSQRPVPSPHKEHTWHILQK